MTQALQSRKFGKYELIAHLATGGMAEIFLARATSIAGFEKLVVIKKILPHLAREQQFVQMFFDEARIAASLNHQNVIQIFDLGRVAGEYFIAMEYLEGESLAQVMRQIRQVRQHLSPSLSACIALQICEGLHYAHTKLGPDGEPLLLVHRDVNPQNIFVLYSGGVKLMDFGIAKATKRFSKTSTGMLKGKYGYMSPEQVKGLPLDARSDLYCFGVVLWEMFTGRKLFRQTNELDILQAIIESEIPPPSSVLSSIPKELDQIALRALARSPEHRQQTASEMRMELSHWLKQSNEVSDPAVIGELMHSLFKERMEIKRRMIQEATSRSAELDKVLFGNLRFGKSDTQPSIAPNTPSYANIDSVEHPLSTPVGSSRGGPRAWKWLAAFFALALAGVSGALLVTWSSQRPTAEVTAAAGHPVDPRSNVTVATPPLSAEAGLSDPQTTAPEADTETNGRNGKQLQPRRLRGANGGKRSRPGRRTPRSWFGGLGRTPGKLRLATSPWTTIYFRKQKLGVTPLVDIKLPAGKHILRAVNPDKGIDRKIVILIKPNQTTVKTVNF